MNNQGIEDIFAGLRSLSRDAFPKKCMNCGVIFNDEKEYIDGTVEIMEDKSGLKSSADDETIIVELFRNCKCGSTLLEYFSDRRDTSEDGLKRRKKFGQLLDNLVDRGLDQALARQELLKVLRGKNSEIIAQYLGNKNK